MGGIENGWHDSVVAALQNAKIESVFIPSNCNCLLALAGGKVIIHMISLNNTGSPQNFVSLQETYQSDNVQLVHLWEDIWYTRSAQVLARLNSILGMNARIHARKTSVVAINQKQAEEFLNQHHLQFAVGARYKYALILDTELVAVACFSGLRKMHDKAEGYKSAELIRFANLSGVTVIGGFTKLLSHFIKRHQPNDVMSYADRDWSLGAAYEKSGFKLVSVLPPATIFLNKLTFKRSFSHRVDMIDADSQYLEVFNTGNLKYILEL